MKSEELQIAGYKLQIERCLPSGLKILALSRFKEQALKKAYCLSVASFKLFSLWVKFVAENLTALIFIRECLFSMVLMSSLRLVLFFFIKEKGHKVFKNYELRVIKL